MSISRRLACLVLVLAPAIANAVGLGNIEIRSALNEPLSARILLVGADEADIESFNIRIADARTFRDAGLERPYVLTFLDFDAVRAENGKSYIEVSSEENIKEPFLNFIIEVVWPDGKLQREYAVLLDVR